MLILIRRDVMNRKLRIAGLALASLTFSTVAMAQQGGGGNGGRGGGDGAAGGSGGDSSVIELRLQDHERARLALERRRAGGNCRFHVCNEPPPRRPPARAEVALYESCGGGDRLVQRDYAGRIIRIDCDRF
jgi:hypothetical protein